jgi:ribosomal protein L11 methyltransferase
MKDSKADQWTAIEVTVDPEAAEAIEFLFNELDSLGTEINHLQKKSTESTTVVGYFNEPPDDETFDDELHYALKSYGFTNENVRNIERKAVVNEDWLLEWKKHWKPTEVGRFIVAPPWLDLRNNGRDVIRIEPNMAFGTGTHETTQLCLRAIEKHFKPGMSFLDVGTGTGILAIAAAMIGNPNSRIVAFDTDAESVSIAMENAVLNGVGERIEFYVGSIDENTEPFDFVAANLTIDVIVPLLPTLLAKSKHWLLLSGILAEQQQVIFQQLENNDIEAAEIEQAGEWISVFIEI